jgi:hypothetical protein
VRRAGAQYGVQRGTRDRLLLMSVAPPSALNSVAAIAGRVRRRHDTRSPTPPAFATSAHSLAPAVFCCRNRCRARESVQRVIAELPIATTARAPAMALLLSASWSKRRR